MAKERGNAELARLLARHGLVAEKRIDAFRKKDAASGVQKPAVAGRPDYLFQLVRDGRRLAGEIEFKAVPGTAPFPFKAIPPEQRLWLSGGSSHVPHEGRGWNRDSWFALTMGDTAGRGRHPRQFWLIPWEAWLFGEGEMVAAGAGSMPYSAETARLPHHPGFRERDWGARELLAPYVLYYGGSETGWRIPDGHPFTQRYGPFFITPEVNTSTLLTTP